MGRCEECRFRVPKSFDRGECHAAPPSFYVWVRGPSRAFPIVADDDWCGVFEPINDGVTSKMKTPS